MSVFINSVDAIGVVIVWLLIVSYFMRDTLVAR